MIKNQRSSHQTSYQASHPPLFQNPTQKNATRSSFPCGRRCLVPHQYGRLWGKKTCKKTRSLIFKKKNTHHLCMASWYWQSFYYRQGAWWFHTRTKSCKAWSTHRKNPAVCTQLHTQNNQTNHPARTLSRAPVERTRQKRDQNNSESRNRSIPALFDCTGRLSGQERNTLPLHRKKPEKFSKNNSKRHNMTVQYLTIRPTVRGWSGG